jgi:uncharacterized membrane protein YfcA
VLPEIGTPVLGLILGCALMLSFGGLVKGVLGVGLPLVTVPLLSLLLPSPQAMGMLVVPVLLANFIQAVQGGNLLFALRRFAPLMLAQLAATLAAVYLSQTISVRVINWFMAFSVISAVVVMALQPKGEISPRHQAWVGPLLGVFSGTLGGVSSLSGPLIITYLMALRLSRDEFVGSISIIYFMGSLPMYGAMLWWGRFGWSEVGWSVLAMAPVYLGMMLGNRLRAHLSEQVFRRLMLAFLTLLAMMLVFK